MHTTYLTHGRRDGGDVEDTGGRTWTRETEEGYARMAEVLHGNPELLLSESDESEADTSDAALEQQSCVFMVRGEEHAVLVAGAYQQVALIDTACAKTVAGRAWAEDTKAEYTRRGIKLVMVPESEPFRFGPGERIWSKEALIVPLYWESSVFAVRVSIVERDVPCLISRRTLKGLWGCHQFCPRQHERRSKARTHTPNGEYAHRPCGSASLSGHRG